MKLITLAAIVSAGTLGAAAPTILAQDRPSPPPPFIQCAGGESDIGNGQGGALCVPSSNPFCPGTFNDSNNNGSIDYGECYYTGGELRPPGGGGGGGTQPPATQPPATQPPATSPPAGTDPPAGTAAPSAPTGDAAAAESESNDLAIPVGPEGPPSLAITFAQIECNGTIHVEYDTSANPAPSAETTHLIVFHAATDPADFQVVEYTGRDAFGSYTFDQLGSVEDSYRLFVTVVFDPGDPDGATLTDFADVIVAADC